MQLAAHEARAGHGQLAEELRKLEAIMAKLKVRTQGRLLWVRTIGSTVVGQLVDSIVVMFLAFYGTLPVDFDRRNQSQGIYFCKYPILQAELF